MPTTATTTTKDWSSYYTLMAELEGMDKLRRIKTRLYEKLEAINEEIEELEEDKERLFMPKHPHCTALIEHEVEQLIAIGRDVSIQLETIIGILGEGS